MKPDDGGDSPGLVIPWDNAWADRGGFALTGSTFELLATNRVNGEDSSEIFRASPTPVKGRLLLRSDTMLYCVGKP